MPILTKHATTATVVTSTWGTITNATGATTGTYATWAVTTANGTGQLDLSGYSFSEIPIGSTVNSVTVGVRHHVTNTTRLLASQYQLAEGATNIGTLQTGTLTTSNTNENTFLVDVTLDQLRAGNLRLKFIARRANATQAATTNLDLAYIAVDYSAPIVSVNSDDSLVLSIQEPAQGDVDGIVIGTDSVTIAVQESLNDFAASAQSSDLSSITMQEAALILPQAAPVAEPIGTYIVRTVVR